MFFVPKIPFSSTIERTHTHLFTYGSDEIKARKRPNGKRRININKWIVNMPLLYLLFMLISFSLSLVHSTIFNFQEICRHYDEKIFLVKIKLNFFFLFDLFLLQVSSHISPYITHPFFISLKIQRETFAHCQ
jgi:hypothetical protein